MVQLRIYIKTQGGRARLFVEGECKDTVIRYVRQVVNAVKRERYVPKWLGWLLFGCFAFGFWLRNRVPL